MKYSIAVNKFDGGLNTKISSLQGQTNESPDLQNVTFNDVGAVATRMGYSKVNSVAVGESDLLHSYRYSGGDAQLLMIRDGIYKLSNVSEFVIVSGSTDIFAAGVRVHGVNANDFAYLSNGSSKYKYDGTDVTLWGVPVPTTAAMSSIVSGDSGLAGSAYAGEYYYRIAYINNANVESPSSDEKTFVVSTTCNAVNIAFDGVAVSAGVSYRAVYRNDFLLGVIDVGTTSVTDEHDDLTTPRDETIVDSRPPNLTIFVSHIGYFFGTINDSTNLYYSDINSPDSWNPSNLIRVGASDGLTIRALAVFNDGLVICKEDGFGSGKVYVLYIPSADPDSWNLEELDLSYGGIAPKAIARFGTFLMILNRNGIYDLSTVQMGVVNSDAISYPIEPDIMSLSYAFLTRAVSVAYKNKLWISVPKSSLTNNCVYQYDYVRGRAEVGTGAWSRFAGMAYKDMCVHDGQLYSSDYDGYVYKLENGHNDNGVAIDAYYRTMHIHGQDEHKENIKVWRAIYVTFETAGDWDLTVSWRGDYNTGYDGTYDVNLDGGGSLWGVAVWGVDSWGSTRAQKTYKIPCHLVSKTIQLTFSNDNIDEYFKVYSVELHYSLRGAR
jgi:hypothetical protein